MTICIPDLTLPWPCYYNHSLHALIMGFPEQSSCPLLVKPDSWSIGPWTGWLWSNPVKKVLASRIQIMQVCSCCTLIQLGLETIPQLKLRKQVWPHKLSRSKTAKESRCKPFRLLWRRNANKRACSAVFTSNTWKGRHQGERDTRSPMNALNM